MCGTGREWPWQVRGTYCRVTSAVGVAMTLGMRYEGAKEVVSEGLLSKFRKVGMNRGVEELLPVCNLVYQK
jgi:hypothetical protein